MFALEHSPKELAGAGTRAAVNDLALIPCYESSEVSKTFVKQDLRGFGVRLRAFDEGREVVVKVGWVGG